MAGNPDGSDIGNSDPELRLVDDAIDRWLAVDPDPETVRQLSELRVSSPSEARAMFGGRIAFGTAGLRAPMGPGPLQMNQLVVAQTTEGLMRWLATTSSEQSRVVIGFDGRHNSKKFADEVARVVAANGGLAQLISEPAPTPVLARAVLDQDATAGVMITASHNPAADNGYKLYLSDGVQLSSPADSEIAAAIDRVAIGTEHSGNGSSPDEGDTSALLEGRIETLGDEVFDRHRQAAVSVLRSNHRQVSVLYTPIHGVGGAHLLSCFHAAGFSVPMVVASQFGPDPDFPTAPYPNPEDHDALRPARQEADRLQQGGVDLDLIVANDPDADRLAVTVWHHKNGWTQLSGDQLGALLVDRILRHRSGQPGHESPRHAIVASSIVSSLMVPKMAEAAGVESVRTLTGFKWLARPIVDRPSATYLMGYEEALGFCVGDKVRDKDGISAALLIVEAAAELKVRGETLLDRLDELYNKYGVHATGQVVVDLTPLLESERGEAKDKALALRPAALDGSPVTDREDLSVGRILPPTAGLVFQMEDGSRVVIRPSGTEPKIKAYVEVVAQVGPDEEIDVAQESAKHKLECLKRSVADLLSNN